MPCVSVQFYNSKVLRSEHRNSSRIKINLFVSGFLGHPILLKLSAYSVSHHFGNLLFPAFSIYFHISGMTIYYYEKPSETLAAF